MKIKITLSYDGSLYCGWQVQNNGISIQSILQDAIEKLTGEKVKVTGSGRTDAGVHAQGQVASFSLENSTIPPQKLYKALNTLLPSDIRVIESGLVGDEFDARKSAKRKTYRYSFYFSEVENPLKERYALRIDDLPFYDQMLSALDKVVGERDFACFNASGGGAKTTIRTIYDARFERVDNDLYFFVTGNGFLYNMVRTLSGTLLEVGKGKLSISDLEKLIKNKDRSACGRTLPAKGLCLMQVEYD